MMKKLNKLVIALLTVVLTFFLCISPISYAASNGKDFAKEGIKPLGVTVSYYTDIYSRGVAWTTMSAADGFLEVVPATSSSNADWSKATVVEATRKVEDSTYYLYKAHIENLTEDSYCYRVGSKDSSNNVKYSDVGTFTIDKDQSEINFIYATDSQDYDAEGFTQWKNLVSAAYDTMPEAQFFAMGGDIVNNSHDADSHDLDQWIYAMDLPKEDLMNSVFMPVAGNHDKLNETFANRYDIDYQGSTQRGAYYSFDYGNVHFVGLNTNESGDTLNVQLEWLKQDLANTDAQWKIIMMHKGPISTGDHSNDSDVKAIREVVLPIMAQYEVDVVLQGHDHVYVRSVPYAYGEGATGKQPVLNETLITEVVDGKSVTFSVDPQGTFYTTANYAGRKSYPPVDYDKSLIYPAENPYNGLLMSQQIQLQTFETFKIVGNRLYFNTYTYDGSKVTLYDSYNIMKDTHNEIEDKIASLPSLNDADIYDYPAIKDVKNEVDSLSDKVLKNVSTEMLDKLDALADKFNESVYEDAYNLVIKIDNLGNPSANKAYMDIIKSIKKAYADLTEEQQALVNNYSTIAPKEEKYVDLLYAAAVTDLAYKCSQNQGVTAFEVYAAYEALTETQKSYVNLHGVVKADEIFVEEIVTVVEVVTIVEETVNGCSGSITSTIGITALLTLASTVLIALKKKKENSCEEE